MHHRFYIASSMTTMQDAGLALMCLVEAWTLEQHTHVHAAVL